MLTTMRCDICGWRTSDFARCSDCRTLSCSPCLQVMGVQSGMMDHEETDRRARYGPDGRDGGCRASILSCCFKNSFNSIGILRWPCDVVVVVSRPPHVVPY
jgi:hypothetical protein